MKADATTDLDAAKRFRTQVELALQMNRDDDGPECSLWLLLLGAVYMGSPEKHEQRLEQLFKYQARIEADAVDDGDELADDVLTRLAMVKP